MKRKDALIGIGLLRARLDKQRADVTTTILGLIVAASAFVSLSACGGTAVPTQTPTPTATTMLVPMGVDYGLKRQCIRSPFPAEPNFYVDNVDCPGGPYPTTRYWLAINEIENNVFGGGTPCIGGSSQSVLINAPNGLVTEIWRGNPSAGYALELKADYSTIANLCTAPTWTAVGLVDNESFSGATFPRPDQAMLQFDATFNMELRSAGAVHAGIEFGSSWLAAGYVLPIQVSTEIEMWDNPNGLGCGAPPGSPPDVLCYGKYTSPSNGITYYSVVFDGSKLNPSIQTPPGVPMHITVNWGTVIEHAIAEGLFPSPVNGWAASQAGSRGSNDSVVGFEIRNDITGPGGPMGDLIVSNYRLSALITTRK
jgi:hypothetical protein